MKKVAWNELSRVKQIATAITAVLVVLSTSGGMTYAAYSHFQTDYEAETARAVLVEALASHKVSEAKARENDRVDRLERDNARYEKDNLNPELPAVEREFNNRQIKKNDAKILCIRAKEC